MIKNLGEVLKQGDSFYCLLKAYKLACLICLILHFSKASAIGYVIVYYCVIFYV